jgi:hypothetical protein
MIKYRDDELAISTEDRAFHRHAVTSSSEIVSRRPLADPAAGCAMY